MAGAMSMSGLCGSSLQTRSRGLNGAQLPAAPLRAQRAQRSVTRMAGGETYPSNWIRTNPLVPVLGFVGWTVPTAIGVPALGGNSLFQLFLASIGDNLAAFPRGPPLEDPFWLYLTVYHAGLFLTIFLGQIGVQGRQQGYFK
ncbi:hypothetical protein WJX84_011915 [Apatococcus fuscideae]|uniref:Photosystem I subunit O n=1 Tax=Apatococcus fuscideae TaxID=2026836 RepID=A0AAW1SWH4_9CHLO